MGDLVHAVEPSHDGTKTNTVMYIPTGPDCPLNRMYIEKAKLCFQSGSIPPDFDDSNLPSRGKDQKKFKGSATLEDLDANAKSMMGFYNWKCNKLTWSKIAIKYSSTEIFANRKIVRE